MIILGIDPGLSRVGYGAISEEKGRLMMIECGIIQTDASLSEAERLREIHEKTVDLIQKVHPHVVAVEQIFHGSNVTTASSVGQARGVILLAASNCEVPVTEYTPLQVKQAVVGYGRADKGQIQYMVRALLNLNEVPKPDDAADAVAVAICHAHHKDMLGKIGTAT